MFGELFIDDYEMGKYVWCWNDLRAFLLLINMNEDKRRVAEYVVHDIWKYSTMRHIITRISTRKSYKSRRRDIPIMLNLKLIFLIALKFPLMAFIINSCMFLLGIADLSITNSLDLLFKRSKYQSKSLLP